MRDFIIRRLPYSWQAAYWARWGLRHYGKTSHFYIEALKRFRGTSRLLLKECKPYMDDAFKRARD